MKRFKMGMGVLGACTALSFGAFAQTAQDPEPHNPTNAPPLQQAPSADSYGQRPENKTRVPELTDQTPATSPSTQAQTSQNSAAAPALAIDPREVQQVFGQEATVIDIKSLSADEAKRLQQHLKDVGYYKGEVDGIAGPKTRSALNTLVRNQFALTQSLVDQGQMPSTLATSLGVIAPNGVMPTSGSSSDAAQWNNQKAAPSNSQGTATPNNTTNNNNTNKARPNPSGQAPNLAPPPPADYPASPPVSNPTGSAR